MMENGFFVYVLKCKDGTFYTGWTTNVHRRVEEHNRGVASKYTRVRLPASLVYFEELPSRSEALKREYAIKQMTRAEKKSLISGK